MASEIGLSISEGREPGTISIRMSKLEDCGEMWEMIATPEQAMRYVALLATEACRAKQLLRTYPAQLSDSGCE